MTGIIPGGIHGKGGTDEHLPVFNRLYGRIPHVVIAHGKGKIGNSGCRIMPCIVCCFESLFDVIGRYNVNGLPGRPGPAVFFINIFRQYSCGIFQGSGGPDNVLVRDGDLDIKVSEVVIEFRS